MVLLGLLLIAIAIAFTADVFLENSHPINAKVLGHSYSVRPGWVVVGGVVAVVVFIVGARVITRGAGRARRRKSILREAEGAARERDELAQQLAAQREQEAVSSQASDTST